MARLSRRSLFALLGAAVAFPAAKPAARLTARGFGADGQPMSEEFTTPARFVSDGILFSPPLYARGPGWRA